MNRQVIWTRRTAKCGLLAVLAALAAGAVSSAPEEATPSAAPPATPAAPAAAPAAATAKNREPRRLDWDALLPPDERNRFDVAPGRPKHDYLGESGPGAEQQGSMSVNTELNGKLVKIPGFVVPLDVFGTGHVQEMFLVPYFGACIHVPPPPPNQIVYVKMAKPMKLGSMYDAVWITGTMRAETKASRFGSAAYTLDGTEMEEYKY